VASSSSFLNNEGSEEFHYNFCRGRELGEHFIPSTLGGKQRSGGIFNIFS
jgi:hypothetical protein